MYGKLITLEGGEGSGKTTQIYLLKKYLEDLGKQAIITREPGGVKISEQIRSIILDKENTSMDALTELLLFVASRRQIVKELIEPTLKSGSWVICDRYTDSSIVYQGIVRGVGFAVANRLNQLVVEWCVPELTLFLDIDTKRGLERAGKRGELNRLDAETVDFHERIRQGYVELMNNNPKRVKRIDADQSIDLVFKDILSYINTLL